MAVAKCMFCVRLHESKRKKPNNITLSEDVKSSNELHSLHSSAPPSSQSPNVDGRPVWGPPIMVYDHLIGEEFEQERKAVLKYYRNDVVKATAFMDLDTEYEFLEMYFDSLHQDWWKAVLKFYRNDVAKATAFLDNEVEKKLLQIFDMSVLEEWSHSLRRQ